MSREQLPKTLISAQQFFFHLATELHTFNLAKKLVHKQYII